MPSFFIDSHTTMINGLGVLGWGVGGIEAEAVMLGQPISMVLPKVIHFIRRRHFLESVSCNKFQKSSWLVTDLENRGYLKVLNDTQLVLNEHK